MSLPITVIVGGGQAGTHTALNLRRNGYLGRIILVGEEPELPYHRPPLTKGFLAGEIPPERLTIRERAFLERLGIEVRLGVKATALRVRDRTLLLGTGETLAFDHLVFAMGSRPKVPKIAGAEKLGVHQVHSIWDAASEPLRFSRRLVGVSHAALAYSGICE